MKVAIIGAGIAGLSCAHELERYGISPVIFERNSFIGEVMPHVGAIVEVIYRPIKDPFVYMKNELGIEIKPLAPINKFIHYSNKVKTTISGNLGYLIERSKEKNDVKGQLYSKLKNSKVYLSEDGKYENLIKEFDYVVIADGNTKCAREQGVFIDWFTTWIKGAVVIGEFDPNAILVWLNVNYCKNAYAYLTPFSTNRASIVLIVNNVDEREIENYWELFLTSEKFNFTVIEEYKLEHIAGHVYPHKIDNLYFAGISGGGIDPFLGFGLMNATEMGVMAARSIVEGKDYEKLINSIIQKNIDMYDIRKAFNLFGNTSIDIFITGIGIPLVPQLVYHTPFNVIKNVASLKRVLTNAKQPTSI